MLWYEFVLGQHTMQAQGLSVELGRGFCDLVGNVISYNAHGVHLVYSNFVMAARHLSLCDVESQNLTFRIMRNSIIGLLQRIGKIQKF